MQALHTAGSCLENPMLLAPITAQTASLSAVLNASSLDAVLNLGNWAGSSHDLRRGVHCQDLGLDLDIDPRDPDWLARLSDKLLASA
jgi:hypothetical protein